MGYLFDFSSLYPAPYIELYMCWPIQNSYLNFKAVLALHNTAHSAQAHKSISFIWSVWSTLFVYLWLKEGSFQCNLRDISVFFLCFFLFNKLLHEFSHATYFHDQVQNHIHQAFSKKTLAVHCACTLCTDKDSVMEFQVSKHSIHPT